MTAGHNTTAPDEQPQPAQAYALAPGLGSQPVGGGIFQVVTPYDRYVAFMRPALVFIAVLSAGLSFLWPLLSRDETSFVFNQDHMERGEKEVRILGPTYSGTDAVNRLFTIRAEEAVQSSPDAPKVVLSGLVATMDLGDGRKASATAEEGIYDTATESVQVPGLMHLETSDGYRLDSYGTRLDLREKLVKSVRPVEGVGPLGRVRADGFVLDIDERKAVFEGNVKMRTTPARAAAVNDRPQLKD